MKKLNTETKSAANRSDRNGRHCRTDLRDPEKESFWLQAVREQVATGKGVREFCRKHRLTEASFYHWRRELRLRGLEAKSLVKTKNSACQSRQRSVQKPVSLAKGSSGQFRQSSAKTSAVSFAEVRVSEENSYSFEVEIARGDLSIRLRGRYDPALLREAVMILGGGSC